MSVAGVMELRRLYRLACVTDVIAYKPGNVSFESAGHGMQASTFMKSAKASALPMASPDLTLGERILAAVVATREAVGCNTNLGIVLLCAPLVQARFDNVRLTLRDGVCRVLARTTVADSLAVYEAIRVASPGGLGNVVNDDVAVGTRLTLTEAMRSASGRDMIAAQYANDYANLFDEAVPYLDAALHRHSKTAQAVTALFLFLLSRHPDTHIRRKHGRDVAQRVTHRAAEVHAAWEVASNPERARHQLVAFDKQLKGEGLNPGTTADLCVASLFICRLQQLAASKPGVTRNHLRRVEPNPATCSAHVD